MFLFLQLLRKKRPPRWTAGKALRTGGLLALSFVSMGTGAQELTLIAPPSNPSFKRALPLFSQYIAEKLENVGRVRPIISKSYHETGQRFESGHIALAFGGSFMTYILSAQGLAVPVVRGEHTDGTSTCQSVLLGKKGRPFRGVESVKGRRLTYVTDASSGSIFARRVFGGNDPASLPDTIYVPARSHGIAVRLVQADRADFAFVKDLAWKAVEARYPDLQVVARDTGEHPSNVLMVSPATYRTHGKGLEAVLLGMDSDPDPRARTTLKALGINRFILTAYPDDYTHTASLVRAAGIDPNTYRFSQ